MRLCTTLINGEIYKGSMITMFTSAQQNEPRNREDNLGFPEKRLPKRLLNRGNSREDRLASKHSLKICLWAGKRAKDQNISNSRASQNVRSCQIACSFLVRVNDFLVFLAINSVLYASILWFRKCGLQKSWLNCIDWSE